MLFSPPPVIAVPTSSGFRSHPDAILLHCDGFDHTGGKPVLLCSCRPTVYVGIKSGKPFVSSDPDVVSVPRNAVDPVVDQPIFLPVR